MFFITFEGLDGCGKSLQIELLKDKLIETGYETITTAEPGGTRLGNKIREILRDSENDMNATTEFFLFSASRSELLEKVIKKHIQEEILEGKNIVLISDRYLDSLVAYQGFGRGLPLLFVENISLSFCFDFMPDLTFWIDTPPETCMRRMEKRRGYLERIEKMPPAFFESVRRGYSEICRRNPGRVCRIEGNNEVFKIHEEIYKTVLERLKKREE